MISFCETQPHPCETWSHPSPMVSCCETKPYTFSSWFPLVILVQTSPPMISSCVISDHTPGFLFETQPYPSPCLFLWAHHSFPSNVYFHQPFQDSALPVSILVYRLMWVIINYENCYWDATSMREVLWLCTLVFMSISSTHSLSSLTPKFLHDNFRLWQSHVEITFPLCFERITAFEVQNFC